VRKIVADTIWENAKIFIRTPSCRWISSAFDSKE
jgi:hypothetical protein